MLLDDRTAREPKRPAVFYSGGACKKRAFHNKNLQTLLTESHPPHTPTSKSVHINEVFSNFKYRTNSVELLHFHVL